MDDPYVVTCSECQRGIDERRETVWNFVHGWEVKRSQGGTNALRLRRPQNLFMCDRCMADMCNGISPHQSRLVV